MTDDQQGRQAHHAPHSGGRWDPLPQGDYDDGATAFLELPEGGIDALLAGDSPLAAPGHGYVPPQITVAPDTAAGTDPAATGTWAAPGMPADGTGWDAPRPDAGRPGSGDGFAHDPGATGQWTFDEAAPAPERAPAPGHDVTGQWSIPVADGDLPDESGEYTTSSLVQEWGATAPATLPGGAPAPWADEGVDGPWAQQDPADGAGPGGAPAEEPAPAPGTPDPAHPADGAHSARPAEHEQHAAPQGPTDAPEEPAGRAAPESTAPGPGPEGTAGPPDTSGAADPEASAPGEALPEPAGPDTGAGEPEVPGASAPGRTDPQEAPAPQADAVRAEVPAALHEEHPLVSYVLRVNGADRPVPDAWIGESLLYVLRERLGLAGAKDGCSQGECGACNVQVDGRLVASCLVPAVTAAGSEVRTVEGLAADGRPSDVQRALARCGAVQCGFCVPGIAMTVHDLLEGNPAPTELETRLALCGNLCRCSGYRGVVEAVQEVVAEREALAAAGTGPDTAEGHIPRQAGPGAGGARTTAYDAAADEGAPHGHAAYGHDGRAHGSGLDREQDGGQG
ncbi:MULTISPECIES: 2Fe-2S iron-sulfur cluster-binding protein [unclassified Streptomyces]|uniref:2Fe-2S iron-sulfur cluster-binding protein n=1 Tax=unclassified Streptomyces TaxID=2593676 RepID=UPI001F03C570|nr:MULTISPECIES: 2Fe-2S iron-sulfur cluster-binding protein [unclassified Streptomyces]MCH0563822.1 (2Fe-2S)-binding protein [Streptomyces sp. MUM 2J]MCH0570108.1 (2Fe-2S)-binding protein [Streptomyces sp. MUM 136J]